MPRGPIVHREAHRYNATPSSLGQFRREEEREEKKAAQGFRVILGSGHTEAKVYNTR
jgi:hypothetical protein